MITSSSKVEIGHGPPKAIIFNNIITKPHFKKFQNILKTERPIDQKKGGQTKP